MTTATVSIIFFSFFLRAVFFSFHILSVSNHMPIKFLTWIQTLNFVCFSWNSISKTEKLQWTESISFARLKQKELVMVKMQTLASFSQNFAMKPISVSMKLNIWTFMREFFCVSLIFSLVSHERNEFFSI